MSSSHQDISKALKLSINDSSFVDYGSLRDEKRIDSLISISLQDEKKNNTYETKSWEREMPNPLKQLMGDYLPGEYPATRELSRREKLYDLNYPPIMGPDFSQEERYKWALVPWRKVYGNSYSILKDFFSQCTCSCDPCNENVSCSWREPDPAEPPVELRGCIPNMICNRRNAICYSCGLSILLGIYCTPAMLVPTGLASCCGLMGDWSRNQERKKQADNLKKEQLFIDSIFGPPTQKM